LAGEARVRYPYSYLRKRGSRGILSACSRVLRRKHQRTA
jgi:hypothetical protein